MANRIEFVASINTLGFTSGLRQIETAAAASSARMAEISTIARAGGLGSSLFSGHFAPGGGGSFSSAVRESFVLFREGLRGNWNRMAGSLTLLAGYTGTLGKFFKSTAAEAINFAMQQNELAAATAREAYITRERLNAAVQAAQAEGLDAEAIRVKVAALKSEADWSNAVAIGQRDRAAAAIEAAEIEQASATMSVTALGWAIAAVALLSIGIYKLAKYYLQLGEARDNFNKLGEDSKGSFKEQADAEQKYAETLQAETDRLKEVTSAEEFHKDAIQEKIKAMQEEEKYLEEIAKLRGASNTQIERMNLAAKQEQLNYLNDEIKKLREKVELDKQSEQADVQRQALSVEKGDASRLKTAKDTRSTALEILDQFRQANRISTDRGAAIIAAAVMGGAGPAGALLPRMIGTTERKEYEVGGKKYYMSFNEAAEKAAAAKKEIDELSGKVKESADALKDHQKQTDKDVSSLQNLQKQSDELSQSIKNDTRYGAAKAALEDSRPRRGDTLADGLIRSGNFLGLSANAINSLQAQMVSEQRTTNRYLRSIDSKIGSHSPAGRTAFSF